MSVSASSSRRGEADEQSLVTHFPRQPGRRVVGIEDHHRLRDFLRIERFGQEIQQCQPGLFQIRRSPDRHRHVCHVQQIIAIDEIEHGNE